MHLQRRVEELEAQVKHSQPESDLAGMRPVSLTLSQTHARPKQVVALVTRRPQLGGHQGAGRSGGRTSL
jgi:hypothetical protein